MAETGLKLFLLFLRSYAFADTVYLCIHTKLTRKLLLASKLLSSMPFTLGIAVFVLCSRSLSFIAPLFNVALAIELKTSSRWGSDPCVPPSGVRWGEAGWRRGQLPKNSCQPVGCHGAPLGVVKRVGEWQRGGEGCAHMRGLLRWWCRLHHWASICLPLLILLLNLSLIKGITDFSYIFLHTDTYNR